MSESKETQATPQTQESAPAHGSGSFYGWLWRRLPGAWPARVAILTVALAVVVVLLFVVVFPWVEPRLPFNQVTVGGG
jgi:hypothetical protein